MWVINFIFSVVMLLYLSKLCFMYMMYGSWLKLKKLGFVIVVFFFGVEFDFVFRYVLLIYVGKKR